MSSPALARSLRAGSTDRLPETSGVLTISRGRVGSNLGAVPSYLVETYLARGQAGERTSRERRARSVAEELTRQGTRVHFTGAIHVPQDEICFFVFDAPSGRDAALAAQQAGLDPFRVVEAISSGEENK
jgi:hypothetical protein